MNVLITKRSLLKGLFAVPAIVAAGSLMKISPTQTFKIEKYTEIPSFNRWTLVRDRLSEQEMWLMESNVDRFIRQLDVIKTINMPINTEYNDPNRIKLMQLHNAQVVYELPHVLLK